MGVLELGTVGICVGNRLAVMLGLDVGEADGLFETDDGEGLSP